MRAGCAASSFFQFVVGYGENEKVHNFITSPARKVGPMRPQLTGLVDLIRIRPRQIPTRQLGPEGVKRLSLAQEFGSFAIMSANRRAHRAQVLCQPQ